jgi:hypothetical protein
MPADVQYLRDNRVALFTYHPPLTAPELLAVFDDYAAACQKASQPVHGIGDVSTLSSLPGKVLSLLRASSNSPLRQRMAGSFVVVTKNAFLKIMVNATTSLMPHIKVYIVDSLDNAWAKIDEILAAEGRTVKPA